MKNKLLKSLLFVILLYLIPQSICAQVIERPRPGEWNQLVNGARFMDRFMPMKGSVLSSDAWGAKGVIPRYIDNDIEDRIWSYWGGNIQKAEDGKYHLFVCGWHSNHVTLSEEVIIRKYSN